MAVQTVPITGPNVSCWREGVHLLGKRFWTDWMILALSLTLLMPALSFRLPRFLRSRRSQCSHSPEPSPTGPRDDAPAAHSSYLDPSPALSSHPSSMRSAPEQDVDASTGTSRSPAINNLTPLQVSTDLQPMTQIGVVDSTPTTKLSPRGPVAQVPARLPDIPVPTDSIQSQQSLLPQHSSYPLATASQQSLIPERQSHSKQMYSPQPQDRKQGMFHQSHNFSATGNFIDINVGSVVHNATRSNKFMKDLLKETIPGAASDSSARHPPPRCHPGTRLAVLKRCLLFIAHCNGEKKMRWVVGKAGIGKSAIMQSVTESPELIATSNASVFFSINGRNDGTKAIMTLSYQFAAKSATYRQVIEDKVTHDPSLLHSSMPVQFEKFIVQPFIHNHAFNSADRVLVIIDGLDECNDTDTQVELLRLISNLCISYPSSPLVWLIASRPEAHITSFFSRAEVIPAYEKEEIPVDSDEARADVEQFLRVELTEIGKATDFLSQDWPDEEQFLKLAETAGGLFAYASTVIRYIGDSTIGDPASQLSDVLNVIDEHPMLDVPPEEHPMAPLDALYARILSKIPSKIMINARKLLLLVAVGWASALPHSLGEYFIVLCNWLGITANEAYAAVNRLRSVLNFPQRNEAHEKTLRPFHKSFIDYIFRSGFFSDIELEAQQLKTQCAFRVLQEAPSGVDDGMNRNYRITYGVLARNIGAGNKILITWPVSEGTRYSTGRIQLNMYRLAIGEVAAGVERGDPVFQNQFCIYLLATRFETFDGSFPHDELRDLVFDESRHHEYMELGILKQIPFKALDFCKSIHYGDMKLQFHCPVTTMALSDPWNSSCSHEQTGQCEQGKEQNWTTTFGKDCVFCLKRMECQFKSWINRSPDHAVLILFTSTNKYCVELRYVDPEDGVSEWTYWFWIELSFEARRKLVSTI